MCRYAKKRIVNANGDFRTRMDYSEEKRSESITNDAGRFGHVGLCQLHAYKMHAVDKGLRGRNVPHQLLLILLCSCLLTISSPNIMYVCERGK